MNRRQLLVGCATVLVAGGVARGAEVVREDYSREAYERALASGEPFLLDFFAPW